MSAIEISGMSRIERLQVMEAIWDSLSHDESEIETPAWHEDVLAGRQSKIKKGDAEFVSIENVKSKYSR